MDEITEDAEEKLSENKRKASFASDVLTLAGGTTFAQILIILISAYFNTALWARRFRSMGSIYLYHKYC